MKIEIFEVKGMSMNSELSTDLDTHIINLHARYPKLDFKKINVLDKESMKKHKDVLRILNKYGIDCLPLVKVDNKIIKENELELLIRKKFKLRKRPNNRDYYE